MPCAFVSSRRGHMIALIDYSMGNMHSIAKALARAGGKVRIVDTPAGIRGAARIVLPGVGAFRDCMAALQAGGMDEALKEEIAKGTPFLGICLGMQVLMGISYEFGRHPGLGLIPGVVRAFPEDFPSRGLKIPHMGWNHVTFAGDTSPHPVLAPLRGQQVYYVHSYVCVPDNPAHILAACSYGDYPFAACIGRDNIIGVQFHPEKSQHAGLAMLEAFLTWKP